MRILLFLENLNIRYKLALLVAPLAISMLVLTATDVMDKRGQVSEMAALQEASEFATTINAVLHETQRERGRTALYMGSGGAEGAAELAEQRAVTDARLAELNAFLEDFDPGKYGREFESAVDDAMQAIAGLSEHRRKVDALSIPTSEALGLYTTFNEFALNATAQVARISSDAELSRMVSAFVALSNAKERSGIERAVLSNAFARGQFEPGGFKTFVTLVAAQDAFLNTFQSVATQEQREVFAATVTGTAVSEVDRMRAVAFERYAEEDLGGVVATEWFAQMTAKIDLMKAVEDKLAADVSGRAASLKSSAQRSLMVSAGLGVAMLVIAGGVGFYTVYSIRKPLAALVDRFQSLEKNEIAEVQAGMEAMAKGDLTVSIAPVTEKITRYPNDEIGQAAETANRIIDGIESTISSYNESRKGLAMLVAGVQQNAQGILAAADQLQQASDQMAAATGQISSAIGEVTGSAVSLSELSRQSAQQVEQVAAGSQELTAAAQSNADGAAAAKDEAVQMGERIRLVAQASERVATAAEENRTTAQAGQESVAQAVASMQAIAEAVGRASRTVNQLGEYGEQIGNIVQTIDEIAAQTNLLALNAAIEAARAGEQGRGFAVVADNVRTLAERSSQATKEIAELIAKVQEGTQEAVVAMEAGVKDVEAGREITGKAGEALESIIRSVQESAEQMQRIASDVQDLATGAERIVASAESMASIAQQSAAGAEEMAQATEKVSGAILQVSSTSEQTSASAEQVSASAEELSAQSQELAATAGEMRNLANALNSEAARFKLESA
ncbi:MAG: hypothetical protein Kow0010_07660 [Dehalococcoidia bacterium]